MRYLGSGAKMRAGLARGTHRASGYARGAMKALIALCVVLALATSAAGRTSRPPAGLSNRGRALWNFEALLHDTFGNGLVCTRGSMNFVSGGCAPLVTWSPDFYVFAGGRHSAVHLVGRRPGGSFGNYPILVWVS